MKKSFITLRPDYYTFQTANKKSTQVLNSLGDVQVDLHLCFSCMQFQVFFNRPIYDLSRGMR